MYIRKWGALLAAAVLWLAGAASALPAPPSVETTVAEISKNGNLVLSVSAQDLTALGYECGDVLAVTVSGLEMEMPLGSNYTDVDSGQLVCRLKAGPPGDAGQAVLARSMDDLATSLGLAEKILTDEDPGYRWDYRTGTPVTVTLSMKEKGGYANEYMLRQLTRTNDRGDYPALTDAQYANFRPVATTGIGAGALYRSSSPIDPSLNRNREADAALERAGVRTVMNLADSEAAMTAHEGYSGSRYSRCAVAALAMGMNVTGGQAEAALSAGLAFFAAHDGPYLVHCKEGKDRTGFVCAVLECLMGAALDEVTADYMETYACYYGVRPGTEQYAAICRNNIEKNLAEAFGTEDLRSLDLADSAGKYLLSIGLDEAALTALREKLGRDWTDAPGQARAPAHPRGAADPPAGRPE